MATGKPIDYNDLVSEDVQQEIKELSTLIGKLTDELKELQKTVADESKTGNEFNKTVKDTVDVTEDLIRLEEQEIELKTKIKLLSKDELGQRDLLKEKISQNNRERKNAAKLILAEKGSMTELAQQLAKNRMAYRQLNEEQRNNIAVGGKLLKTIQAQDAKIKKLDATIGNHQRNVGNYAGALGDVAGQFGIMGGVLPKVQAGLTLVKRGFGSLKAAIASTGIGLLVLAIGSLVTYLTQASSGTGKLAKVMIPLKAVMSTLTSLAKQFGEAIALFVSGDWDEGFALLKDGIMGASDEYQRHAAIQKNIYDLEEALHKSRLKSILGIKQLRQQQGELRVFAKDETKDIHERLAAQEKVIELEKEIAQTRRDEHALEVAIMTQKSALSEDSREEELELQEARAAHVDIINQQNSAIKTYITYLGSLAKKADAAATSQERLNISMTTMQARTTDSVTGIEETTGALIEQGAVTQEVANVTQLSAKDTANVIKGTSQIMSLAAGENKSIQIATAIINTFAGVGMALGTLPPPASFITAAVTLATGIANVAKIQNTQVPSYAVGADELESDQLAQVHKGERILPAYLNKQLTGIDNVDLPRLVNIGLKVPKLLDGIETMVSQQRNTNNLLSRFAYVDNKGAIHYLSGNKTIYV